MGTGTDDLARNWELGTEMVGTDLRRAKGGPPCRTGSRAGTARGRPKVFQKVVAKQSTTWYDRRTRSGKGAQTEGWAFYG